MNLKSGDKFRHNSDVSEHQKSDLGFPVSDIVLEGRTDILDIQTIVKVRHSNRTASGGTDGILPTGNS